MKVRADEDYLHTAVIHSYIKPLGTLILCITHRAQRVSNCKSLVARKKLGELDQSSWDASTQGSSEIPHNVSLSPKMLLHTLWAQIHKPVREKLIYSEFFTCSGNTQNWSSWSLGPLQYPSRSPAREVCLHYPILGHNRFALTWTSPTGFGDCSQVPVRSLPITQLHWWLINASLKFGNFN